MKTPTTLLYWTFLASIIALGGATFRPSYFRRAGVLRAPPIRMIGPPRHMVPFRGLPIQHPKLFKPIIPIVKLPKKPVSLLLKKRLLRQKLIKNNILVRQKQMQNEAQFVKHLMNKSMKKRILLQRKMYKRPGLKQMQPPFSPMMNFGIPQARNVQLIRNLPQSVGILGLQRQRQMFFRPRFNDDDDGIFDDKDRFDDDSRGTFRAAPPQRFPFQRFNDDFDNGFDDDDDDERFRNDDRGSDGWENDDKRDGGFVSHISQTQLGKIDDSFDERFDRGFQSSGSNQRHRGRFISDHGQSSQGVLAGTQTNRGVIGHSAGNFNTNLGGVNNHLNRQLPSHTGQTHAPMSAHFQRHQDDFKDDVENGVANSFDRKFDPSTVHPNMIPTLGGAGLLSSSVDPSSRAMHGNHFSGIDTGMLRSSHTAQNGAHFLQSDHIDRDHNMHNSGNSLTSGHMVPNQGHGGGHSFQSGHVGSSPSRHSSGHTIQGQGHRGSHLLHPGDVAFNHRRDMDHDDRHIDQSDDMGHGPWHVDGFHRDTQHADKQGIPRATSMFDDLSDDGFTHSSSERSRDLSDDRKEMAAPIEGLELLGRTSWSDVAAELQSVRSDDITDDFKDLSLSSIPVFSVNPLSEEIPPNTRNSPFQVSLNDVIDHTLTLHEHTNDHGRLDDGAMHPSDIDHGSFSLLGIDPGTFETMQPATIQTSVPGGQVPDHPPPIFPPEIKKTSLSEQNLADLPENGSSKMPSEPSVKISPTAPLPAAPSDNFVSDMVALSVLGGDLDFKSMSDIVS